MIIPGSDDARIFCKFPAGIQLCGQACQGLYTVEKGFVLKPGLVIMDVLLLWFNGLAAAQAVSRDLPRVPIILLTLNEKMFLDLDLAKREADAICRSLMVWLRWLANFNDCSLINSDGWCPEPKFAGKRL